ncbi:hypothetical protein A2Y85_07195 [candidate division WOR-3 bacterium RBG_13_43_14]|uniref:NAD(P)-binding domain-containing protein n=1 Tax=candidate division WOR-3 bacterium RBG_13_43_14 TaxID=1802590 RepID=A0A1F4UCI8_UNCW3|nr:MAG: hypothetical protein A2Y85_07195 [candidate division WOR-3 bacterium RBG_13_43_14]
MKVILVTGSEGFVGTHLLKVLQEGLYRVVPTCYPLFMPKNGKYLPLEISNAEMVHEILKTHQPDIVFHLAAMSSVSKSFKEPLVTYQTNIIGTANILEAARNLKKKPRIVFISTCEVYGGGENISEDTPVNLMNPYAVSKYSAELICQNYIAEGLDVVILRPFTHTGTGHARNFVLPTIAAQIAEIELGKRPPIVEIGNTEIRREFMNVQDIVNGYSQAISKADTGRIYNISSGYGYSISDALKRFQKLAKAKFEVRIDPSRIRKIDIPVLVGNGELFNHTTRWKPKIKFEKTIEDLLNYWRAKV